jgi:sortase (surface protein transpeptidase)
MRIIDVFNHRSLLCEITAIAVLAAVLTGCASGQSGQVLAGISPSVMPAPLVHKTLETTVQLTPTPIFIELLIDPDLDLHAEPVEVPLEIQIPALKVQAPVIGVGLNSENEMDAPRGPIGSSIWQTAMWYRGSGIPGEPGTATFAGHVNDPLGLPGVFGHLRDLLPGDLIIVHFIHTSEEIHFVVNENIVYNKREASDPAVTARIFGKEPEPDGLSHIMLITCTGYIVNGQYDGFRVIYATRSN